MTGNRALFRNLELTRFYNFPITVAKLENIDTPIEIIKIYRIGNWGIFYFQNLFTEEIINLKIVIFCSSFYEFKSDAGSSGVRVKFYNFCIGIILYRNGKFFLAKAGKMQ